MLTDMRIVTQKILIRQSPDLKRTICKFCDTLQIEGQTSSSSIENTSRGGRKPWADVLAIRCGTCGHVKRFPVSVARQKRRPIRHEEAKGEARSDQMVSDAVT
jgi:ribonuclease P protein subunit RPR2